MLSHSPDGDDIVDRLPCRKNVVVAVGLSGHGFKTARNDDVGHAAVAVGTPDQFVVEAIDPAGENTLEETAEILSAVTGRDVEAVHVPIEDAYESLGEEFTVMCEEFTEVGYSADIAASKRRQERPRRGP